MRKYIAETVGTFTLVFFGVGTAVVAGSKVGIVGIAFAFGLGLIAAAYGIGPISGCHINPAVSLGAFVAGRLSLKDMIGYWCGQFLGALIASYVVFEIASGTTGFNVANGMGQNGWGAGYGGEYNLAAAFLYEVIATLLFLVVILGSTQNSAPTGFAGLVIGTTLVAIHLLGINITGTSVNPARSLGPALFVHGQAIHQLWLFFLAPAIGAIFAGALFRTGVLSADGSKITRKKERAAELVAG
jgi:aquaporin Z